MLSEQQNMQIRPYPIEILISIYLVFTGFLIVFFHSQLTNISSHITFRIFVLLLLLFLAHQKVEKWQYIGYLRIFLPFLLLGYLYTETDYLNNLFVRQDLDPYICDIESFFFSGQPSISFASFIPYNIFAEFMYFGYFSYYLLVIGIPVYICFFKDWNLGIQVIFIIMGSFLFYYIIYIFFPVAGPQFYFIKSLHPLPEGYLFGPAIRLIQFVGEAPTAAFPSSHVSICMMLLWICIKHAKELLYIIIPVSILLLLSTVYIRAHYVIDVLAGLVFTPIVFSISSFTFKIMNNSILTQFILKQDYEYSN